MGNLIVQPIPEAQSDNLDRYFDIADFAPPLTAISVVLAAVLSSSLRISFLQEVAQHASGGALFWFVMAVALFIQVAVFFFSYGSPRSASQAIDFVATVGFTAICVSSFQLLFPTPGRIEAAQQKAQIELAASAYFAIITASLAPRILLALTKALPAKLLQILAGNSNERGS